MKVTLSLEDERHHTVHRRMAGRGRNRRTGEDHAAGVTESLARAMHLAGGSRSAVAGGDQEEFYQPPTCVEERVLMTHADE